MADLTLNDVGVVACRLAMPRIGRWTADLELATDVAPTGAATLTTWEGGLSLTGWVAHGGVFAGSAHVRVVGGRGGLDRQASAVYYRSVPARVPLSALLSELGEALSADSDAAVTNALLERWTRVAEPGGAALGALVDKLGADWRVRDDGTIWVGRDTYPEAFLGEDIETIAAAPSEGHVTFAGARMPAEVRPGVALEQGRVAFVEHVLDSGGWRSTAWLERAGATDERALAALEAIARGAVPTAYLGSFPGRVTSQAADGSLDVTPDDPTKPPLSGVPLRVFAPHVRVLVDPGARVRVTFEDADPAKPCASVFETDGSAIRPVAFETSKIDEHFHKVSQGILWAGPFPCSGSTDATGSGTTLPCAPLAASQVGISIGQGNQKILV